MSEPKEMMINLSPFQVPFLQHNLMQLKQPAWPAHVHPDVSLEMTRNALKPVPPTGGHASQKK
jgi:hypothetical protein